MKRGSCIAAVIQGTVIRGLICALAVTLSPMAPVESFAQTRADPEAATGWTPKPLVEAREYMIVAAHPAAAEAGADILAAGGSAVDAAIAAQLVLNVVEPQSSGLGGGGFALHWDAQADALTAWDGRETAPLGATADMFLDRDGAPMEWLDAVAGGTSVGTPALARLLGELHASYGRLPWAGLFAPAIALASNGFEVSPRLAQSIVAFQDRLSTHPEARAIFFDATGSPLAEGALLKQPMLAETLRLLAEDGADAFYTSDVAGSVVAAVQAEPRPSTLDRVDLASYDVIQRRPVCARYRGRYAVCGMGPPSSGATTVGQILGLLDHFPANAMDNGEGASNRSSWRLFAEASRLAYADRAAYLADPDVVSVPTDGLLDQTYLTIRAQSMTTSGQAPTRKAEPGNPPWREGRTNWGLDNSAGKPGTTHISVIDADGDVFALTSSIESAFGSGRMAAGFLLNNQLTDFSFQPEIDGRPVANAVGPGKRPRSSMAPTIVFDEIDGVRRPVLVLGSPGGSRIIEYVAAAIVRLIDLELAPHEAAAAPHVSHRNQEVVAVESGGAGDAIADDLARAGYNIERREMTSGLHIIQIGDDGVLRGGADPRREGVAIGR